MTSSCSTPRPSRRPQGKGGFTVRAHASAEAFRTLAPEWRALLGRSRPSHPFYDPAWHLLWWKHLGSGVLHICEVRRPDGGLLAVAPFVLNEEGLLRLTGGEDLSDYLDIAAEEGGHRAAWEALLAHLEGPGAPDWRELLLRGLPVGSPTLEVLAGARAEREDVCPVIHLPGSWEDYLGMLNTREERDLRRKIRKARREPGLEIRRTRSPDRLEEDLETFIQLHALSHPEKANFWNEARGAFFREMAHEAFRLGWLDLSILRVDGHPAAANFAFDHGGRVYLYNSGYDPNERALSAGIVLLAHNIEEAIQAGRAAFDLLRGDEPYKYRFGAEDEPIWRLRLARKTA